SGRICPASRKVRAARRARWLRGSPTPRASRGLVRTEWIAARLCGFCASIAKPAVEDRRIGVNSAVAKERPIAAGFFAPGRIAFDDQDFFLGGGSFGKNLPERVRDEGVAPELQAGISRVGPAFESDAIHDGGEDSIGNGVRALNGAPGVELRCAELSFLAGMPADAGG